eukprot:19282_6
MWAMNLPSGRCSQPFYLTCAMKDIQFSIRLFVHAHLFTSLCRARSTTFTCSTLLFSVSLSSSPPHGPFTKLPFCKFESSASAIS